MTGQRLRVRLAILRLHRHTGADRDGTADFRQGFVQSVQHRPIGFDRRSFLLQMHFGKVRSRGAPDRDAQSRNSVEQIGKGIRMGREPRVHRFERRAAQNGIVPVAKNGKTHPETLSANVASRVFRGERHRARHVRVERVERRHGLPHERGARKLLPGRGRQSRHVELPTSDFRIGVIVSIRLGVAPGLGHRAHRGKRPGRRAVELLSSREKTRTRRNARAVRGIEPEMRTANRKERSDEISPSSVEPQHFIGRRRPRHVGRETIRRGKGRNRHVERFGKVGKKRALYVGSPVGRPFRQV